MRPAVGRTTATYDVPNTVDEFYFWIDERNTVQPYDFVTARSGSFRCIGVVNEVSLYTDAQSHLSNRLGADVSDKAVVARLGATVAKAIVFYSYKKNSDDAPEELRAPAPSNAEVCLSTPDEIYLGLSVNQSPTKGIPSGALTNTLGEVTPVLLDSRYLLGPQGAHLNVSGITGLATKTSYMMFLLYAINKVHPNEFINIIFNVKQADLMRIEEPTKHSEFDTKLYKEMFGSKPEPFTNVIYYQPRGTGGNALSYSAKKGSLYSFELTDSYSDLDLLFADVDDTWHTVEAFSRSFRRDWDKDNRIWRMVYTDARKGGARDFTADTWLALSRVLEQNQREVAEAYGLQSTTVNRIRRELNRLTDSTLFPERRGQKEVLIRDIIRNTKPGQTIVIDIAKLRRTEQTFVVGNVFRELEDIILQESEREHRKAIVVVDELNSLAPASFDNPLKEQIIEVARKGRSSSFIILGAEQFASEVDEQIIGNSSLRVFGRTSAVEVSSSAYRALTAADKSTAMRLRKGEMLLSFPLFRSNVRIVFPRPPYETPE